MPRGVLLSLALPERRINGYLLVSATFHGKSSSTRLADSILSIWRRYACGLIPFRQQGPLSPYSRAPFTTVITAEKHIDCPSIILPSTSKLLVGFDLFNCVNRASQRKALMHHLTLKVTTSKMTFNGTMRFNVSLGRLFQYTKLSVICVSCIKYQRQHFRIHNQMCN